MKKTGLVFILFCLTFYTAGAQNLLPNPSFEQHEPYTHCNYFADTASNPLKHWYSSDFYLSSDQGVRLQYQGVYRNCRKVPKRFEEVSRQQIDGNVYVQIHYKDEYVRSKTQYKRNRKTYLYTRLKEPLSAQKHYLLRFKVRHAFRPIERKEGDCLITGISFSLTRNEPQAPELLDDGLLLHTDTVTHKPLNTYWAESYIIFRPDSAYNFLSVGYLTPRYSRCYSYGIDAIQLTEYDTTPVQNNLILKQFAQKIQFETASATLTHEAKQALEESVAYLKNVFADASTLSIEGHTDNVGDPTTNLRLSQARADAIKAFLVENGLPAEQIQTKGYGDKEPIADNQTAAGRAQNRRVELSLEK